MASNSYLEKGLKDFAKNSDSPTLWRKLPFSSYCLRKGALNREQTFSKFVLLFNIFIYVIKIRHIFTYYKVFGMVKKLVKE